MVVPYSERHTNNVGEYLAVQLALEYAEQLALERPVVLTDSQLVVEQVRGTWKCRKAHLLPLRDGVRETLQEIGATLTWISREQNVAGKILEKVKEKRTNKEEIRQLKG